MKTEHEYTRHKLHTSLYLPLIVLFFACCFLATLVFTIRPDVFFSGDAGLKFLVIKQINSAGEYKSLNLQQPEWVLKIWQEGFYPFKEPFVYNTSQGKIISFPPAFQWLNAPLYKWFGYRGMYVIPCLSLVLLWCWFLDTLKRSGTSVAMICCGFFLMAFCSPLTVYAAVYWEHTLALLLVFAGIVFHVRQPVSFRQSIILGVIAGLSVWFRPEALVLSSLLAGMALYNYFDKKSIYPLFFILGFMAALIAFFVFNAVAYGSIFGAHGYQVLDQNAAFNDLSGNLIILTHVNVRFFIFFPVAGLFYILAGYLFLKKPVMPAIVFQLTIIILIYSLITPFILPNAGGKQWGPRYFLPLIPLILVTLSLASIHLTLSRKWLILLIPLIVYSIYLNVYEAGSTLQSDYTYRVTPGMNFLKKQAGDVVVVQNQYIAQEFAAAFDRKKFFLAENKTEFLQLIDKLRTVGILRVTYIDIDNKGTSLPDSTNQEKTVLKHIGDYFFMEYSLK